MAKPRKDLGSLHPDFGGFQPEVPTGVSEYVLTFNDGVGVMLPDVYRKRLSPFRQQLIGELQGMTQAVLAAEQRLADAVDVIRREQALSWEQIGWGTGLSADAARKRYTKSPETE